MLSLSLSLYRTSCFCFWFYSSLAQSCFRLRTFALSCMRSLEQLRAHSVLSLLHTNKHSTLGSKTSSPSLARALSCAFSLSRSLSHTGSILTSLKNAPLLPRDACLFLSLSLSLSQSHAYHSNQTAYHPRGGSLKHTHMHTHTPKHTHKIETMKVIRRNHCVTSQELIWRRNKE